MDRELLCDSLRTWLQTFNVEGVNGSVEDLTDGVAMAHVLHQIAPNFFSDSWLQKIKVDIAGNWRLKVSNLKKILKAILDYYAEVLNQHINDFHMPDVNALGEDLDTGELGRLLQLILGCAVNCDEKHDYIQRIMAMEESVQLGVMTAIQELMTKEAPGSVADGSSDMGDQVKRTMDELNRVMEAKEEISQRCHELDLQVATLQEERSSLAAENERLNERINQADSLEDPSTPAGRRYQQLQNQVEQLQEELYRVEAARDDFKIKIDIQEKEVLDLQQKNEDLNTLADKARTLKDEMDVLRHTSDKVTKYEQIIDTYKKKLEEMSDLKGQVKMLEEKNTFYVQKNMDLEEEVRKSGAIKSQLELYKRQVQELQIKSSEETRRADKAEFEAGRVQEKMVAVQREKERLIAERDSLKETNEELRCTQVQKDLLQGNADSGLSLDWERGSMGEMLAIHPEIKERLIRLQHENKMLKLQRAASEDDAGQVMQTMLDDTNRRNSELESDSRIQNQRILELEAQLEDLRETTAGSAPSEEVAKLGRNIATLTSKMTTQEAELKRRTSHEEELETSVTSQAQQVTALQETLNKKDEEMREMEQRYKQYLEKCKSVSTQTGCWLGTCVGTQTSIAVIARADKAAKMESHRPEKHQDPHSCNSIENHSNPSSSSYRNLDRNALPARHRNSVNLDVTSAEVDLSRPHKLSVVQAEGILTQSTSSKDIEVLYKVECPPCQGTDTQFVVERIDKPIPSLVPAEETKPVQPIQNDPLKSLPGQPKHPKSPLAQGKHLKLPSAHAQICQLPLAQSKRPPSPSAQAKSCQLPLAQSKRPPSPSIQAFSSGIAPAKRPPSPTTKTKPSLQTLVDIKHPPSPSYQTKTPPSPFFSKRPSSPSTNAKQSPSFSQLRLPSPSAHRKHPPNDTQTKMPPSPASNKWSQAPLAQLKQQSSSTYHNSHDPDIIGDNSECRARLNSADNELVSSRKCERMQKAAPLGIKRNLSRGDDPEHPGKHPVLIPRRKSEPEQKPNTTVQQLDLDTPYIPSTSPEPGCLGCCVEVAAVKVKPGKQKGFVTPIIPTLTASPRAQTLPVLAKAGDRRSLGKRSSTLSPSMQAILANRTPLPPKTVPVLMPASPGPVFTRNEAKGTLLPHLFKALPK